MQIDTLVFDDPTVLDNSSRDCVPTTVLGSWIAARPAHPYYNPFTMKPIQLQLLPCGSLNITTTFWSHLTMICFWPHDRATAFWSHYIHHGYNYDGMSTGTTATRASKTKQSPSQLLLLWSTSSRYFKIPPLRWNTYNRPLCTLWALRYGRPTLLRYM